MFWNDPNLYSVAFKDIPTPRFFNPYYNFTPYMNPMLFTPQFPQFPPQVPQFTPPVTPFFHGDRPMTTPYGYNYPYFQGYRPFGL